MRKTNLVLRATTNIAGDLHGEKATSNIVLDPVYHGLSAARGEASFNFSANRQPIREPASVFIAGPGTVVSVRFLDLPFMKPRYSVEFKTEGGELIQVWHSGNSISLVEGMRGMLTYSRHPDEVIDFRVVDRNAAK
jgi:hypothetical protein